MSETVTQEGHESSPQSMDVNQAANAFLNLMEKQEASPDQPKAEPKEEENVEPEAKAEVEAEAVVEEEENQEEEALEEETPTYRVKASGEEVEVTLDELIKSYQLERDVRKKQESLAHEKKGVDEVKSNLESERKKIEDAQRVRDTYAQRLQLIEQHLTQQNQAENIDHLKESDPLSYAVKVAERQERDKQIQTFQAERQRLAQEQQAEHQRNLEKHLEMQKQILHERIPDLLNEEKATDLKKEMWKSAMADGHTEQKLNRVLDASDFITIWKASQYDKLMATKPDVQKKVKAAPKMIKAGVAKSDSIQSEKTKRLKNKLKRTGKVADAARLFEQII
jgi:acetylglutamate kinase